MTSPNGEVSEKNAERAPEVVDTASAAAQIVQQPNVIAAAAVVTPPAVQQTPPPLVPAKVEVRKPIREQIEDVFVLNGFSTVGRDHIFGDLKGNGNQDCYGRRVTPKGIILVSCDGCGSTPDSSTGSRAAVRIILNQAQELLEESEVLPNPEFFAAGLQYRLLKRIETAAGAIAGPRNEDFDGVVFSSYLFTVMVAVITPDWTAVFACGDGYYAINGEIFVVEPRDGNKPEYLAYGIYRDKLPEFHDVKLKVLSNLDTIDLKSIMVATDGMEPVISNSQRGFTMSMLWDEKKYRNPNEIALTMSALTEERVDITSEQSPNRVIAKLVRTEGVFTDDATFVVALKNAGVFPADWNDYRKLNGLKTAEEKKQWTYSQPASQQKQVRSDDKNVQTKTAIPVPPPATSKPWWVRLGEFLFGNPEPPQPQQPQTKQPQNQKRKDSRK